MVVRIASAGHKFARDIRDELDLAVSVRTIQSVMHQSEFLDFRKADTQHDMQQRHRDQRVEWAENHVTWDNNKWDNVIFSDENKFNLDGPDNLAFYWHDLRKEERIFSRCQKGGGGTMVWGAYSSNGQTELAFLEGNVKSVKYTTTLEQYLLPFAESMHTDGWIFQQDSASIHTSNHTKGWFSDMNVTLLDWTPKSPDLNPIENIWGVLARDIYRDMSQFRSIADLNECTVEEWANMNLQELQNLSLSLPRRCAKILRHHGNSIDY